MCALSAPASVSEANSFSYKSIYRCYLECRRNKRNSINALNFEFDAEINVLKLQRELKTRTYHPSRSILFAASKPKLREIFAADFRDRVVHHILIDYLKRIWEPIFIHDSYACRDGKGTHRAVIRLQDFIRSITCNGNIRAYYLQLDIKDFFMSIDKEILFELIRRKVKDPDMLWLTRVVLFWDCTSSYVRRGDPSLLANILPHKSLFGKENVRGLPIGNLTSQFFANVYMNELDQFVKHQLKVKHYVRYVDDFVILSEDSQELRGFKSEIEEFIHIRLKLNLHPSRQKLLTVCNGIDFLGYIVRHNYKLVRARVVNNLKEKIRQFRKMRVRNYTKLRITMASYFGHFKFANTYRLKSRFMNYVK